MKHRSTLARIYDRVESRQKSRIMTEVGGPRTGDAKDFSQPRCTYILFDASRNRFENCRNVLRPGNNFPNGHHKRRHEPARREKKAMGGDHRRQMVGRAERGAPIDPTGLENQSIDNSYCCWFFLFCCWAGVCACGTAGFGFAALSIMDLLLN